MLVLYHTSHSTCSQKVRLVLHEKGVKFDEVRIDLAKKEQLKPDYLALNPNGVVPTLVDDGIPIIEFSVICEISTRNFRTTLLFPPISSSGRACGPGRTTSKRSRSARSVSLPLIGRSFTVSRAKAKRSSRTARSSRVQCARNCFSAWARPGLLEEAIDKSLGELSETCRRMDEAIAKDGPWIMGGQFTLADVLVMPSIDRMADLGLASIWEGKYPRVAQWYERLQARPAFQATYYPGSRVSDFLPLQPLYAADREQRA